jgi:hypothetical protein
MSFPTAQKLKSKTTMNEWFINKVFTIVNSKAGPLVKLAISYIVAYALKLLGLLDITLGEEHVAMIAELVALVFYGIIDFVFNRIDFKYKVELQKALHVKEDGWIGDVTIEAAIINAKKPTEILP